MADPLFDLTGRVALVTGGSAGLGRAIAEGYRARGARVAITGRDAGRLAAAAEALGDDVLPVVMDLADEEAVAAAVAATAERFGRLDVLVNNAGDVWAARLPDFPAADWDALVGAHLRGAFLCARHAAPRMAGGGGGKIVNVASVLAGFGVAGLAHYCSAKAGVIGLTRALAVELAPLGIQVNVLVPGFFDTELSLRNTSPERRAETRRHTPAGRWGRPEELVGAAVLLASAASDYMTGSSVVVDGGYTVSDRDQRP